MAKMQGRNLMFSKECIKPLYMVDISGCKKDMITASKSNSEGSECIDSANRWQVLKAKLNLSALCSLFGDKANTSESSKINGECGWDESILQYGNMTVLFFLLWKSHTKQNTILCTMHLGPYIECNSPLCMYFCITSFFKLVILFRSFCLFRIKLDIKYSLHLGSMAWYKHVYRHRCWIDYNRGCWW